ncbi:MAG: excinuclease ABC subunit UvrC [Bacteroidaceae bacterium]|nr:excinuclease ABC subunit UvrC [Bacteroidaceae bacterium]
MITEKEKTELYLRNIVANLPECPGCYQYLDETGTIIYVGKAKNLKRRVYSYFSKEHQNKKTAILVSKIRDIKYVVVKTEGDALLLENNLIKKWNPRYNILLKDGKTYPSICITNEYLPRIFQTRKIDRRMGTYFGPYSHIPTLYNILELIKKLYPLRSCRESISAESIANGKHKECLEYHIKNCKAPCRGWESRDKYMEYINEAKEILKGNTALLQRKLMDEMGKLAEEMRFEEAEVIKKKYLLLENYRSKSEVVSNTLKSVDVFNIEDNKQTAYINYLHVTNGCINQAFTFELTKRLDETPEELLIIGIGEIRNRYGSDFKEIIVPFPVELQLEGVTQTIPVKGDKKKLLELSRLNVLQYKKDKQNQMDKLNPEQKSVRLMKELQDALQLDRLPMQIECFDNSNISGTDAVAGCIVFKKCKPSKADYRRYIIKTVEGADDYASMQEVVRRRYSRAISEETPLPDLIITDGGKGQMECVRQVVEDELGLDIPIAGLAKDDKHRTRELLFGFPPQTIGMKPDSTLFRLLVSIQEEVHRYAVSFHREKRSKHQIASELDSINGIGPKTKAALLKQFKSVKRIAEAELFALEEIIGKSKAAIIYGYFHTQTGLDNIKSH